MAIFHFTVKIVGRSKGKSVISASAYLNGDVMKNEETGRISYYTSKKEVVYTSLMMCENAPPEWLHVPEENIKRCQQSIRYKRADDKDAALEKFKITFQKQRLWNEVLKIEKNADAQLGRSFEFSLPKEWSRQEQIDYTTEYIQKTFVDEGMCADWSIHDKPYLSIPELIRLKNEGLISSQLRDTAENRSDRLKEDEIEAQGKTLYLGSKHSDFRITFYEKGYEQAEKFGKELNPDWNRYELRFRHKKAVRLVEELLKDRDVARIALSVLNEKVRFLQKPENSTVTRKRLYPTYPPWEELMQDVGKIKLTMNPEKKTLERTWQWLNVAVSPSLKLMDKIGKLDNRDYIRQLIERGQMNEEQQRIYEDYKKSFLLREEERRIFDRTYTEHDTDKESPYSE